MSTVGVILLVVFVIVSILLVLLVLIQDDGQNGMGGLLGGRGTQAFGSHSASVLTKATGVLVAMFFVLALALALINKKPQQIEDLEVPAVQEITETSSENAETTETSDAAGSWWDDSEKAE